MPAKVTTNKLKLSRLLPDARSFWAKELKKRIVEIIQDEILSGRSPVTGRPFKQYSKNYALSKKGGKRTPVDFYDTGILLNSLKATQKNTNRTINVEFTGRENRKIARYHNEGKKPMTERRLLPTRKGEEFNQKIQKEIVKAAEKAIESAIKKQR